MTSSLPCSARPALGSVAHPPIQLPLSRLQDPRIKIPMVDLAGAFAILGCAKEPEIVDFAESGSCWAWHIGDLNARRCEWRFLAKSLTSLQASLKDMDIDELLLHPIKRQPATWAEVLSIVLPRHDKPFFSGRECKRALNCRRVHFINLIYSGQLPGSDYRRGPNGSPSVARKDFIHFLEQRLVGGL